MTGLGSESGRRVGVSGQGSCQPVKSGGCHSACGSGSGADCSGACVVHPTTPSAALRSNLPDRGRIPRPTHLDINGEACNAAIALPDTRVLGDMGPNADIRPVPSPFGDDQARTLAARTGNHRARPGRRNGSAGQPEDNQIHSVEQDRRHVHRRRPGVGIRAQRARSAPISVAARSPSFGRPMIAACLPLPVTEASKLSSTDDAPSTETTEPRARPPLGSREASAGGVLRALVADSVIVSGRVSNRASLCSVETTGQRPRRYVRGLTPYVGAVPRCDHREPVPRECSGRRS